MRRCLLPLLLLSVPCAAQEESAASVQTFASEEMTGQPLALAVDDAGHVFLSCTGRAFGRGIPDISKNDKLRDEDASVLSLTDRRELLQRWSGAGLIPPPKTESAESVVCLSDTNADGIADLRTVTAEDFHDALDGPAGGLLALADGALLFGCTPSLWRLEDDNQDLHSDRRLPVLTGFGTRTGDGLPGLRAITEGPDGFIYFTTTARGCRVTSAEGERFVLEDSGGVWRCLPDGTELELLARGLHDPAGIAVDLRGRIFVADSLPNNEFTHLLRVLPGADFSADSTGLEIGTIPARATGFIIEPSTTATGSFPAFLLADGKMRGGVIPVTLREESGALHATAGPPVWQGTTAAGLAAAPDGSVVWSEWDRGFTAEAKARVLRHPPRENSAPWKQGATLLSSGIATLTAEELPPLLEHPHPLVRRRACRALVRLGFQESLDHFTRTARRSPSLPARLESLWGLGALARSRPMLLNEVQLLTTSAEPDIRALAVHIIGETSGDMPVQELLPLLRDPSRDVREEVALALARLRPPGIAEDIFTALHQCGDTDPALRHVLTFALCRLQTPVEIAARGRSTSSPAVKTACLAALISLRAAETADFLDDENPAVVIAAGRALFERRIVSGYPSLVAALEKCTAQPALRQQEFVRRALAAALYLGDADSAASVANFISGGSIPAELRAAALETLAAWDNPPARDPLTRRHDPPLPRPPGLARPHLERLKPETSKAKPDATTLAAAFNNVQLPELQRADALQQLAALQPPKALELARSVLPNNATPALRIAARAVIMKHDSSASYTMIQEALLTGTAQEAQTALLFAQRFDSKQSTSFWLAMGKKFMEDKLAPVVELEVWEALQLRDTATRGPFRRLLEVTNATFDDSANPLARWRMCEAGGDPDKGRRLYETGRTLNCTACHSLDGRGGTSGPELDHVASRLNRLQLLGSLVQPSALIAPGCGQVTVTLQDGTSVSGILRKRDDTTLLLATPRGHQRLNADNVQSLSTPVSTMPPASALLTLREIRDLVAWLETLK